MNVYSCKNYFPFIPIILATLIPICIGVYYIANYKNPFVNEPNRVALYGVILIALGAFFLSIYVYTYADNYRNIFLKAQKGQTEVVEGKIENFVPSDFLEHGADHFEINGIEFVVRPHSLAPGYHKIAARGGAIKTEGMLVRIKYVEYDKEVFIVSIDVLQQG